MKSSNKFLALANTFGTLGYFSVLLQWSWAALLLIYPALMTRPEFLFPDAPTIPNQPVELDQSLTPLMAVIALIVTIIIIIVTIITLIRLPKRIGERGATLTHSVAHSALPIVTRHKKISKKERQKLSYRVILLIKLKLILLPLIAIVFIPNIDQLGSLVIWSIMVFCASWSVLYFVVQQVTAKLARLNKDMLW